jgi:hypothetical protein
MADADKKDSVLFEVSKFLASALLIFMVKEFGSIRDALTRTDPPHPPLLPAIASLVALIYCANIFRVMHSMLRLQCWDPFYTALNSFGASWRGSLSLFLSIALCLLLPYWCLNSLNAAAKPENAVAADCTLLLLIAPVFAYVPLDWIVRGSVSRGEVRSLAVRWVWMDAIAFAVCVLTLWARLELPRDLTPRICESLVGVVLLILFLVDYGLNRNFYFPARHTVAG